MKKGIKAFTLVELIVVITILAILATIGFVSFSGYLAGTRDTNRVAQLKSMSDALELYRTKKDLPIPDDKVDVKAGTEVIYYQGDIGKNVLETIEYTESGLDPKYKEYFSYTLTRNKKYFQLMAFLEEPNADILAGVSAENYSDSYPFVKGKKLGILTDLNNNPIQKVDIITSSGYIDTKIARGYLAYIDNGKKLEGREIGGLKEIAELGGIEQNLIAWYDFETIDGTGLLDLSGHNYTGNIIGNFLKIHTGSTGAIGKAMTFDGANTTDYIILPNESFNGMKDFSISMWVNYIHNGGQNFYLSIAAEDTTNKLLMGIEYYKNTTAIKHPFAIKTNNNIENNKWKHIVFIKNNSELELYINNKLQDKQEDSIINNITLEAKGIVIGQEQDSILGGFVSSQAFIGKIDDLRIYNGVLPEGRIEKIYNLGK